MSITAGISDWVGERTTTIGTGSIGLSGSLDGFAEFSTMSPGEIWYTLVEGNDKETGIGTLSGNTITRTNIFATLVNGIYTSNGSPIALGGKGAVYCTLTSQAFKEVNAGLIKLDGIEDNATRDQIASEVPYSNNASGLTASDVQAAIDETVAIAQILQTALQTSYDNSVTGFAAIEVQSAIDELKAYTDALEVSLKQYADDGDAATLVSANSYADAGDVTTLASANSYADAGDVTTLNSANSYADAQDAITLTAANSYTDGEITTLTSYIDLLDGANVKLTGDQSIAGEKNFTDDKGIKLNGGTGATGAAGNFRYNNVNDSFEGYFGGEWQGIGGGGLIEPIYKVADFSVVTKESYTLEMGDDVSKVVTIPDGLIDNDWFILKVLNWTGLAEVIVTVSTVNDEWEPVYGATDATTRNIRISANGAFAFHKLQGKWSVVDGIGESAAALPYSELDARVTQNTDDIAEMIESGSTTNGEYIKFSDGSLICSATQDVGDIPTSLTTGALFQSTNIVLDAFAYPFIAAPTIVFAYKGGGGAFSWLTSAGFASTTNPPQVVVMSSVNRTWTSCRIWYIANGRWK